MKEVEQQSPKHNLTKQLITVLTKKNRIHAKSMHVCNKNADGVQFDILSLDYVIKGIDQDRHFPVRNVEPIKIHIAADLAPIVEVRNDFPLVPHLNENKCEPNKTLCYSDLPYRDVQHKMNATFLLICINDWFVKTARNKLHQSDQPLEPFFPDVNDNLVVFNLRQSFVKFRKVTSGAYTFLIEDILDRKPNDKSVEMYALVLLPPRNISTDNTIHSMPKTIADLQKIIGLSLKSRLREELFHLLSIRNEVNAYNSTFGQNESSLLSVKTILMMYVSLSLVDSTEYNSCEWRAFLVDLPLRDFLDSNGIIKQREGNRSKFIHDASRDTGYSKIKLKPFNLLLGSTPEYLKLLNGGDKEALKLTMVGVGALGSQIISNCARSGYGRWHIIDDDIFYPHNIARHALMYDCIGMKKVDGMYKYISHIAIGFPITKSDRNIFDLSDDDKSHMNKSSIIIDTSASIAVQRYIALNLNSDARRVSFFVNPIGNCTIMLLEDKERNHTLDLLEMQYYSMLIKNERFHDHLTNPDKIVYSGTCRSVTSKISQDDIALSAAFCSKSIKRMQNEDSSKIVLLLHNEGYPEAIGVEGESWAFFSCNDWNIFVKHDINSKVIEERLRVLPNETGGVLIGAYDYMRKRIYIADVIDSPDDSISSPTSYIRGCKGLEDKVMKIRNVTAGYLNYIGEWHSHPGKNTIKSYDDILLFGEISAYCADFASPACMLIIGDDNCSIYVHAVE